MAFNSSIEWTTSTWNPVTGCSKVSPGCRHCYAERMAKRLQAMGQANYREGFRLSLHPHALDLPLRWGKPQTIFVNSMSDLFHEEVPDDYILQVFAVMEQASWHQFQVLTKRAKRLAALGPSLPWPNNVWMGVSVETATWKRRVDHLRLVPAAIRFLSIEPLLGPMGPLDLDGIHWVIVGGESGPGARPMLREWVVDVQQQCLAQDVPFFFKQWGGTNKKKAGRLLDGRTWDAMPSRAAAEVLIPA
ncbi:MAG: phage Gp37/Gp68 family protein [Candidatus Sumerlaeota bacterium]|nr:phage Gp37/Gp68 family protein [Candidatus Sumerlaeota bacterium]